jgi:hypothetical protein
VALRGRSAPHLDLDSAIVDETNGVTYLPAGRDALVVHRTQYIWRCNRGHRPLGLILKLLRNSFSVFKKQMLTRGGELMGE